MTKREQFIKDVKESLQNREWTNAALASIAFVALDCQKCPCGCEYPYGNNCSEKIFNWLVNYGDEEVEE